MSWPLRRLAGQQVARLYVAEHDGDGDEARLPALWVVVVREVFTVVMGLFVLAHETGRERRATPIAAVRLSRHPGEGSLEVLWRHVVASQEASRRQRPAVV
jgi:hypothetical protein